MSSSGSSVRRRDRNARSQPRRGKRRDALLENLGKYKTGKSCLYINKLADVDMDVLEDVLRNDWDAMARRYPE